LVPVHSENTKNSLFVNVLDVEVALAQHFCKMILRVSNFCLPTICAVLIWVYVFRKDSGSTRNPVVRSMRTGIGDETRVGTVQKDGGGPPKSKMQITQHAQHRIQQRGVTHEAMQLVLFACDRRVRLGAQCSALALSRQRAQGLRNNGFPDSVISRAERLTLIVADDGAVLTVLKGSLAAGRRVGSNKPQRGKKRGMYGWWQ